MALVPVTSDSDETRLAKLEAAGEAQRDLNRILTPLVAGHAVMEEKYQGLRADVNKGFEALRDELKGMRADTKEDAASARAELRREVADLSQEVKELKSDIASRSRERRAMLLALFICGTGLAGNFIAQLTAPDPPRSPAAKEQTK